MTEQTPLLPLAHAAERRLGRLHVWAAIRQRVTWIAGAAAASAALRPFAWPLHHESPSRSALRALAFAAAGGAVVTVTLIVRAWRSRPSLLTATRRIDDKLGLAEVVASGVAFEQANRDDEMASFAIRRARQAASNVAVEKLFTSEPVERPRFFRLMIAAAAAGLVFGAVDRLVVERALHPVTRSERTAAESLKKAAAEAKAEGSDALPPSSQEKLMAEAAQRAAEAAERGDRAGAQEALEDMRKAERALSAENRDRAKSLRDLKDSLEAKQSGVHAGSASDALDEMQSDLSKQDSAEMKALAERLEKAEEAARAAAEKSASSKGDAKPGSSGAAESSAWSKAAEALKEAREAAARGDKEGAKRAMEKAQKEIQKLEQASKRAGSKGSGTSKMSEQASALDRSLRAGSQGKEAGDGPPGLGQSDGSGKGGKGEEGKGSGSSKTKGDGEKEKGGGGKGGGGPGDRDPGPEAHRLKLNGDLQARADVKEGEKAVSAIEGVGKGGDPKAYAEVFPAYDTVVEDGLREDNVPAARRPTVRRYFKAIRPGDQEGKSDQ